MGHKAKSSGSGKAEDPKGGKKDGKKDGKKPAKDSKDGKKSTSKQQVYDYRPSGSADVFAQFAPYEERFVTLDDAEVQLALQALQKKDPTTRLRNVAELHQLLSTRPKSLLSDVCGPFLHTYLRLWPQDSEPGVREGLQRCLQVLVESLQRDFAKHLRSAFPTWLCAMFDTYTEVAQAARTAFAAAFASDEKRRNVFRHSLKECLELLTFYLRHNEQSLHEELGITRTKDKDLSLERQDRYARVLAASLSALGELVHVCAPKGGAVEGASGSLTSEQLQPFVEAGSSVGVWSRLNHKQPTAVRRAAVHCLVRILRCEAEMGLPCATAANRAAAMHVLADEAIPPSSACAMIMAFAAAGEPNDCWEGLDANKAFIQLHMLLQRAKSGVPAEAADFLTRFQELIQVFPQSAWLPGKAELLLKELVEALAMPRGAFLTSASAAWRAYFAICRTSPTVDRQWRWHPVMLFLSQRVETEEREETERMSLPEVSLTRPVLGALPKALQEELPLMPVEAVPELLEILKNSAPMLEAGGSEASCSGGGKSMWRAWVQLLQQLKSQDDASSATAELLRHQLRRLFLVLFTTDVACVFEEALEALSVLLCCDEVFREDLEDKELQEALANSASSTGVEDLNFEWPPEARLLQWPLLPWWCSLMNAKAEAAEPVGRKLVQPILEILGRRLEEEVREGLRESLLKVLLSSSNEVAFSLRLCLECFSSEFHTVESLQVQQALQQLVEQIASGELQPTSLEDALRALYVASSAMATSRCGDWMKVLVSTAESCEPQVQLRLILLVAKVVTELRVEALCEELQQLLEPLCRALLELLIRTEDADAWNMLSKLLKRLDTDQASQLLAERVQIGTGGNWLRLLLEGSSITSLSPLSLLCKARSRDRDGSSHLLPRGAIRPSQLRDSALNAARLLRDERNEDLVLLERQEPVVLEVFWEVLLVVSTGICEEEVAVQGARKIWSFLQDLQTPASTLKRFLHLCIQEVSAENSTWWLDLGCRTMLETLPVVASLQSLAVLRRVLAVCSSSSAGHAVTVAVAEEALNSVQTSGSGHPRAGWGFARAALVPYLSEEKVLALRSQMRLRLLDLCGEKKVTEPVLALAGALELRGAELCAATKTTGETSKAEASAGPLISEVVGASDGANEALDEVHEELDTGLQELLEKLLRWSQSSSSSARSDALANWASSCWEELHCSGTMASRLTRLALETLGVSSPLGSAAAAEPLPVLPGVWRLATALCRHNQWPPERWPPLLASVVAGHVDAADGGDVERRALLSTACTEDAAAAACGVVARAPVGQVEQLAMLLSACDQRLRTAAALRLQEQVWVPAQRSGEPSVAKANEALEKFEELLEAGQTGDLEEEGLGSPDAGRGELPSVSDVSYTVLYAVLGSQMTKTLWSASDALHSLASWEASHRGDDGDEEDSQNHSKWMRAAPGGTEEVGHPATSSSSPPAPQRVGAELPLETIKACVATMAAWETLLAGIDRGLLKGSPAGSSEKAEKAEGSGTGHASPAVLLAALLQLNPDQLAHDHAKVFPAQAAPASPWSSPLQPLLRLLCHLLTSPRLAGFALDEKDTSEALLSAALSQEAPVSYDVLPLAARTLLLALRVAPAAVRSFWEKLPRRRDQSLVEKLISRSFTPLLLQAEVAAATALLEAEASRLPEVEAQVIRRPRQLLLLLAREDLKAELFIQIPASFPLRPAQAEVPEKMPGIPKPRVRNWILQARQVLSGQRPLPVGQAVLMWTRSFALFFKGVKDCPICYNVIQLTTQTIPRKACPTCKNKFHNECLYQWFRTSSKTTCPLCTQPF